MKRRYVILLIAIAILGAAVLLFSASLFFTNLNSAAPVASVQDVTEDSSLRNETLVQSSNETSAQLSNGTSASETEAADNIENAAAEQIQPEQSEKEVPELRFMAVGDIMLGRGVGARLNKAGGFDKAFEDVAPLLNEGDIVFANLESPLTASTHSLDPKGKIVLKAKPEAVSALTQAGFNMVSLANNHMMDYYEKGLYDTMSTLDENGILHTGGGSNIDEARKPVIMEVNGIKVGLLAYTDMAELTFAGNPYLSYAAKDDKSGLAPRKYEIVLEDVKKLREQVDLVAVSLHWGIEDSFKITADQVEFAHNLIDNGADIILGHHPHQFQGMEIYKGKPIMYSMGNFIFDQNDPENQEGFIIDMKYRGTELVQFSAIPVRTIEKTYVRIQTGENASELIKRQVGLCSDLGTTFNILNDVITYENNNDLKEAISAQ